MFRPHPGAKTRHPSEEGRHGGERRLNHVQQRVICTCLPSLEGHAGPLRGHSGGGSGRDYSPENRGAKKRGKTPSGASPLISSSFPDSFSSSQGSISPIRYQDSDVPGEPDESSPLRFPGL